MGINNKKRYKFILVLMIATMFTSLFTGCGNKKRPLIKLSVWGPAQEQDLLEIMASDFAECYSKEARFEITICEEDESTCKGTVLFSPEAAADVYMFADDQLRTLVDEMAIAEIKENKAEIMDACGGEGSVAVGAASVNDDLYAYPSTASNGYFLYYNSKYFSKDDAKSLEKILDVAKKNGKKFGMEITSGWYMYGFFKAAGLDVTASEDGKTNICDWNSTQNQFSGTSVLESLINIATHEGFINVGNDALVEGIKNGEIVACISGTWNAKMIQEVFGDGYAACKLPTFKVDGKDLQMHSVAGYKLVGVNAYSKNLVWAKRFAEWITNEENQKLRFSMVGEGPANLNAAASDEVQESLAIAALSEQSKYAHLQYVADNYWDAAFRLGNVIAAGNVDKIDLQELLDTFVKNITN